MTSASDAPGNTASEQEHVERLIALLDCFDRLVTIHGGGDGHAAALQGTHDQFECERVVFEYEYASVDDALHIARRRRLGFCP